MEITLFSIPRDLQQNNGSRYLLSCFTDKDLALDDNYSTSHREPQAEFEATVVLTDRLTHGSLLQP